MKTFLTFVLILISALNLKAQNQFKFAIIGDFGYEGANELNVSILVKSWNPEFIITLGDNNYDYGEQSTIDPNIGQYYSQFIYPYIGNYGSGDTVNRFFPSLGNHDWDTDSASPYLNYFTLPGNERYYDFIKGDIHFFVLDSDPREPDGTDSNSVQALWLKNSLASSTQQFNLIYFHHPAYTSGRNGNFVYMQWPFKRWGADAVFSGHDHTYERIYFDGLTYFVNGLGGRSIDYFNAPITGSVIRYNDNYGAMLVDSYEDSLTFRFYSISGNLKDYYKLMPSQKNLQIKLLTEGFYDPGSNKMQSDTFKVVLRNSLSPYNIVDSSKGFADSTGSCNFKFTGARNATLYYLAVKHRNSIETWSSSAIAFASGTLTYNFTSAANKAYGNNQKQIDVSPVAFGIYSGDVNQDGIVDITDNELIDNDSYNFATGYVRTDVNGDNIVDVADVAIADNNAFNFVIKLTP
ncbi:MAG: metallophosphoesterase [bacterium]